jgi:hypothetical protein
LIFTDFCPDVIYSAEKHLKRKLCNSKTQRKSRISWGQWLTPVSLSTWKEEIRRIMVQSRPGEIVHETLSQKNLLQKVLAEWLKW